MPRPCHISRYVLYEIRLLLRGPKPNSYNGLQVSLSLVRLYRANRLSPTPPSGRHGSLESLGNFKGAEFEGQMWRVALWHAILHTIPGCERAGKLHVPLQLPTSPFPAVPRGSRARARSECWYVLNMQMHL